MPRWRKGEEVIERLLEARQLEHVPADPEIIDALRGAAARHVATARACAASDPEGSYALAYDAVRKAATALLAHQGLRPTSAGGHIALVEAMEAQFPDVPGLRSVNRMRRRRNQAEYPDPAGYDPLTEGEVLDAVKAGDQAVATAEKLIGLPQLGLF